MSAEERPPFLYRLLARSLRPLLRALFRVEVSGLEHLPTAGGVVISGHFSYLDPFVLGISCYPRQIHFIGKDRLGPVPLAALYRQVGTLAIRRGAGQMEVIEAAAALARAGALIGIFPEGTRRSKGVAKRFSGRRPRSHSGAARVALLADVPIVPVGLAGLDRFRPRRCIRLQIGAPLSFPPGTSARKARDAAWDRVQALESTTQGHPQSP